MSGALPDLIILIMDLINLIIIDYLNNGQLLTLILYGDEKLPLEANKAVLSATINFISKTQRFSI